RNPHRAAAPALCRGRGAPGRAARKTPRTCAAGGIDFGKSREGSAAMAKRIDPATLESTVGTLYPPPYDEPCRARERTRLGEPAGGKPAAYTHREGTPYENIRRRGP